MAYDPSSADGEEAPAPAAAPSPALQAFQEAFTHPGAKAWATDATEVLNDYFQKRRIAQENAQAGQNFVSDITQFRDGLSSFVRNDPAALPTALSLVHPALEAVIGSMPQQPADAAAHHQALSADIQREVAISAITAAAERHGGVARALLEHPQVKGLLGDDEAQALYTYTNLQADARVADATAQQEAAAQQATRTGHQSAINYLSALDGGGTLQFPAAWNQAVFADPRLPPAGKALVSNIYQNLRQFGDAPESDPFVAAHIINAAADGAPIVAPDVLQHAGDGLRLQDALHLANVVHNGPQGQAYAQALNAAVRLGREALATPENGVAGEGSFSRFMNWLLPAARAGAVLDPASPDYVLGKNRLQAFAPRPQDYVRGIVGAPRGDRPSLHDIFAGGPTVITMPGGRGRYWWRQGEGENAPYGGSVNPDPFTPLHGRPGNENPAVQIVPRGES